ncbi:glucose-6-phosphate isomerase (plasmid) [Legionella adelaidensis]|uniref:Glucose-6-phosphate isomerase n=1 Tax=Legionella adelaidensis TaxID=45056 RepID=A0A0W0R4S3_9GAMM|nr:hypothetical protein [Legionella adelaidensis]KTC66059.1 glucose-6-phosphate isomerase [Legionella adelaidensis]VEH85723.1 glucose-6-phosphate isomerase [Legionella adelaidensis]
MSSRTTIWKLLESHALNSKISNHTATPRTATHPALQLDYTGQNLTDETLQLLFALADACSLQEKIKGLFNGDIVNPTEHKPALHTALRAPETKSVFVNNENIIPAIHKTLREMEEIANKIRTRQWLGFSGKPIENVVNIGIGGSDLGPRFCINALSDYITEGINFHFIQDADPKRFEKTVKNLNPETTLFIIASKSFTTQETLFNAKKAIAWIGENNLKEHFIAITEKIERAKELKIVHVLPIWSWVGGRYSFCSAVNLITVIALGVPHFREIIAGARNLDQHFTTTSFEKNVPVLSALIGLWNTNFLNINNLLLLTYAQELEYFIPFVQQLEMESNGKSIDKEGKKVNYPTCPILWGSSGNQAEHSYYQLLCQGTHKITADLVTLQNYENELIGASVRGKKHVFQMVNVPFTQIILKDCSPFTIGALVAFYEHKVFVQSVLWNINPFDQPGVEDAKKFKV